MTLDPWHSHLRRALRLAARGRYRVPPNPMVGAVAVAPDGEVVGEGWHAEVGGAHAEAAALAAAGRRAEGATLCVTLEPCNHHGRTPPCTEAILAAGVRRVVVCHRDPDPTVAGGGLARLAAAGVEVACGGPVDEALRLNLRFLVPALLGRPQVTLKWAMSLDGKIATA
ncbi:MAG TPA: bifunctional diaminohydroxyphosphoribosylaminopyrimidine deaminase/5-amino-6-(5-phosphoribosylamino)uracil reductase RibD, partial [Thermoanaerobaculia bacterium]|nr:bifunctional diaminohydroxyphosphoribosylaminopyrimidine deaminase/5-amino-6-(5-phosphoribosylamino)uracil reductase RibD [Thermoanaerobaculia bacterium]